MRSDPTLLLSVSRATNMDLPRDPAPDVRIEGESGEIPPFLAEEDIHPNMDGVRKGAISWP